ncbi:uncharacterized protein LOC141671954 isoform X2 [Apium graveolens]
MALKIVSLTSSSSGCERNWSTFEGIHTKKRNRLDVERLHNLIYVQFNAKLLNKKNKKKDNCNRDVLLANDAIMAQGWIVEGGDNDEEVPPDSTTGVDYNEGEFIGLPFVVPRRAVRELDEDDFESEVEVDDDIIFDEFDQERW